MIEVSDMIRLCRDVVKEGWVLDGGNFEGEKTKKNILKFVFKTQLTSHSALEEEVAFLGFEVL